jgi:O-antigen/teichoic acid export membrane protein
LEHDVRHSGPANPPLPAAPIGRSVLSNCLAIVIARSFWAVSVLATMPAIVAGIGTEAFGIWESMLAIGATAAILQTVTGGTLLWQISHQVGENNLHQAKRLIRLGSTCTLLMFAIFVPLAWFSQDEVFQFLRVSPSQQASIGWIFPATVGLLAVGGFNQTLMSALAGLQRASTAAGIQVVGLIVAAGVTVLAIWSQLGFVALWLGSLSGFLVTFVALWIANWRAYGGISMLPVVPSRQELSVLAPFATLLLASNLTLLCRDHLDKIVLTVVDSARSTGYFAIAQRLTTIILQISVVVQIPLTASIGAHHARGDWKHIIRTYGLASHWLGFSACLGAIIICSLRTPLLVVWFGHDMAELHGYLATTIWGATVAVSLSAVGVALAKGIGRPGLETTYTMVTLILTLLSKPFLIWWLGSLGTVLSSAVAWGLGCLFFLVMIHREIELPRHLFRRDITVVAVAAVLCLSTWPVSSNLPAMQNRAVAAALLAAGIAILAPTYWLLLYACHAAPELHDWVNRLPNRSRRWIAIPSSRRAA